ncbi:MAG: response regulator [Planctomycetes bacterium]|nr:response regulator [Planctomycetota bacterium]
MVDDNITSLFVLSRQMEFIGIECVSLEKSASVIDVLEQAVNDEDPFDVAIIDLNMPDPDGWVLARHVSRHPDLKNLPLILLSATPKYYHHEQALAAGYHACMSKPVKEKDLVATLEKVFAGERELRTDLFRKQPIKNNSDEIDLVRHHILMVEDNVVNQKVGMRMLRKLGCTVDLAQNGREAIEAIQNHEYDMVFMDCQMPVMDGYEATKHIRELGKNSTALPIVALTANAMTGDREKCIQCGMNDHVGKPFNMDDLYKALERWAISITSSH